MTTADWALFVAIASASLALGGLVWQFLLYRLSGHRLQVRLIPTVIDWEGAIVEGADSGFGSEPPPEITRALGRWTVDLAQVRVTNIGRLPVSVSNISLDFGSPPPWYRFRRHTVRGFAVPVQGGSTDETLRIEPGAGARVFYEVWPLVSGIRSRRPGRKVVIRGSAHAAGRRRSKRSAWRRRWVFQDNDHSLRGNGLPSAEMRAFEELWRLLAREGNTDAVQLSWMMISKHLREDATAEDISAKLETILEDNQLLKAFFVLQAYLGQPPALRREDPER